MSTLGHTVLDSAAEHEAALAEIGELMNADPQRGTPEFDRLRLLAVLVEAYEREHHRPSLEGAAALSARIVDLEAEVAQLRAALVAQARSEDPSGSGVNWDRGRL